MATVERSRVESDDWFDERGLPWLENGERMDQKTFHERYAKMPPGTKAELIGGIVYINASPLTTKNARGDARMSGWLFHYSVATPGVEVQLAATTILGPKSEPQPDSAMLILPEWGGRTSQDQTGEGFTLGGPELVVEISVSSRSYDLHQKLDDYEKGGVGEYLVLDLRDSRVRWFSRVDDRFQDLEPGADGVFRSRTFPGLWLDPAALIANDKPQLIATLDRGLASPEQADFVARLHRRRQELAGEVQK
jgi:Uma2 family endonuclease